MGRVVSGECGVWCVVVVGLCGEWCVVSVVSDVCVVSVVWVVSAV